VGAAPEFFFLEIRVPGGAAGPLLERVMSGDGRTICAPHTAGPGATSGYEALPYSAKSAPASANPDAMAGT
jgi:hypothetical protein